MKKLIALMACLALAQVAAKDKPLTGFDLLDAQGIGAGYQARQPEPEPQQAPKRELGPIDTWRFDSCQQDAGGAPTPEGVAIKMRVCRRKFGQ